MEIINNVNDQELLLTSQMKTEYEDTKTKTSTTATSLIKTNSQRNAGLSASLFSNCRIGSIGTININIYKQ